MDDDDPRKIDDADRQKHSIASIFPDPSDDAQRLIYADVCLASHNPSTVGRGELIALGCKRALVNAPDNKAADDEIDRLEDREAKLLDDFGDAFHAEHGLRPDDRLRLVPDPVDSRGDGVVWDRGFPAQLSLRPEALRDLAARVHNVFPFLHTLFLRAGGSTGAVPSGRAIESHLLRPPLSDHLRAIRHLGIETQGEPIAPYLFANREVFPLLESLHLGHVGSSLVSALETSDTMERLHTLSCSVGELPSRALRVKRSLRRLVLQQGHIPLARIVREILPNLPDLQSLSLRDLPEPSPRDLTELASYAGKLERLDLDGLHLTDTHLHAFLSHLKSATVRRLSLRGNRLGAGCRQILGQMPQLEYLDLRENTDPDFLAEAPSSESLHFLGLPFGIQRLAHGAHRSTDKWPHLNHLAAVALHIPLAELAHFVSERPIRHLDLPHNRGEGCWTDLLANLHDGQLRSLCLSGATLNMSVSTRSDAFGLLALSRLRVLDLRGMALSQRDVASLTSSPALSRLVTLHLDDVRLNESQILDWARTYLNSPEAGCVNAAPQIVTLDEGTFREDALRLIRRQFRRAAHDRWRFSVQ